MMIESIVMMEEEEAIAARMYPVVLIIQLMVYHGASFQVMYLSKSVHLICNMNALLIILYSCMLYIT